MGKKEEVENVLREVVSSIANIAQALESLLPETATTIQDLLSARPLKKPAEPLFARKL